MSKDRASVAPSSEKLSARNFLKTRKEFEEVYRKGTSYRGRFVVLVALAGAGISQRKVGFVASKKVGGAVKRNRVKRLMREAFRRAQKHIVGGPAHLVLISRPAGADASYQDIVRDIERLLQDASLMRREE